MQLVDAHEPLSEEDYRLLAFVLRETRPDAVTFEYHGTDGPAVASELTRLRVLLNA